MKLDTLWLGDSIEVLRTQILSNSIDCIITSPPYDDLRNYDGYQFDFKETAKELYRVLKPGGVLVWVVGDKTEKGTETLTSFKQAIYFVEEVGFFLHDTMIYHKNNPVPVGGYNRYYQAFEYMFVLSKGKPKCFNPIMKERSYDEGRSHRVKIMSRDKNGEFKKKRVKLNDLVKVQNVWHYNVGGGHSASDNFAKDHPAIFPEELVTDHIDSWTNENDVILDCFAGSGTTLKMCILKNRHYIGIECSPKYIKIAEERINLAKKQKEADI